MNVLDGSLSDTFLEKEPLDFNDNWSLHLCSFDGYVWVQHWRRLFIAFLIPSN